MAKTKATSSKKTTGSVDLAKRIGEGLARPMRPIPTSAAPYASSKAVTVRLRAGELEDDGSLLATWSYLKGGTYEIEAAYDDRVISREQAKRRLRAELGDRGMQVTHFLADPDAARIIGQLERNHAEMNRAGLGSPDLDEFNALVIEQVAEADDPKATFDAILQLMREHRAGATA